MSVAEGARTPGTLLELAGVLQALNVTVLQGVIQGCSACGDDVPALPERVEGTGRLFKLWVRDAAGEKLRPGHAREFSCALGRPVEAEDSLETDRPAGRPTNQPLITDHSRNETRRRAPLRARLRARAGAGVPAAAAPAGALGRGGGNAAGCGGARVLIDFFGLPSLR